MTVPSDRQIPFRPIAPLDGYLRLEDHGLIGDGTTAALVGRDGGIPWMCVPRFDSPPLFCALLDRSKGGRFVITPEDLREARQYYEDDTGVLVTEMRGPEGVVRVTDLLTLNGGADLREDAAAGRGELLRHVSVLSGRVRLLIDVDPFGGADAARRGRGLHIRCFDRPELDLQLSGDVELAGLRTTHAVEAGDSFHLMLRWCGRHYHHRFVEPEALTDQTREAWRRWSQHIRYEGPQAALVRRSAVTLKLLDHFENGAIVAAPTSSLPEWIGGALNWDYRYVWVRDAAFSVFAFRRIGLTTEASGFLGWVLDQVERHDRPKIFYDLFGNDPSEEREDWNLSGYRGSQPVRWGNEVGGQRQDDVYGEIIDCAYEWADGGGEIDDALWRKLRMLADEASARWDRCDHGIWELRNEGRAYTYTAGLCQVSLDRMARLARWRGHEDEAARWHAEAKRIEEAILERAWDEDRQALSMHFDGGGLDASVLALPLRRVLSARHPRMVATTQAVRERLGAGDGLLYRFLDKESPEDLHPCEGAFLLCSFWLVDNLAEQGQLDEAMGIFDSLCARANPLGLLSEQIDPSTGGFLGNFPQAFSHVGLISSAVRLARLASGKDRPDA